MMSHLRLEPIRSRPARRLRATLEPAVAQVAAGARIRFRFRLDNPTRRPLKVELAAGEPGDGWTAFLPVRSAHLTAGAALVLFLRVDSPSQAAPGTRATFGVTVMAAGRTTILDVEAVVA